jgi:hypothetical protein
MKRQKLQEKRYLVCEEDCLSELALALTRASIPSQLKRWRPQSFRSAATPPSLKAMGATITMIGCLYQINIAGIPGKPAIRKSTEEVIRYLNLPL